MGIYVKLDVLYGSIPEEAWEGAFQEAILLAQAFPDGLVALRTRSHFGFKRRELARQLLDEDGGGLRICGDAKSGERAEQFYIPRKLKGRQNASAGMVDILTAPEKKVSRIYGEKTQGLPFHQAMVAISALFETRLSGMALALGDLDREDCEKAVAWANSVLNKPIHLPVCVHAEALISRLRSTPEPIQVVDCFNNRFLGSKTDRWRAHVRLLADLLPPLEALATELGSYHGSLTLGAIVEVRAWLDATGDLRALAQAACKEERGPKWPPKRLMEALEITWALAAPMDFDDLKRFEERGGIGALQGIFGSFYEEMNLNTVLRGFHCNVEEAVQSLAPVLELPESRLRKLLASAAAKTAASIDKMNQQARVELAKESEASSKPIDWPAFKSEMLRQAEMLRKEILEQQPTVQLQDLKKLLIASCSEANLALKEETWQRLDALQTEKDLLLVIVVVGKALAHWDQSHNVEQILEDPSWLLEET